MEATAVFQSAYGILILEIAPLGFTFKEKIWKGHMPSLLYQDTFIQYTFTRQKTVDVLVTVIV